MGKHDFLSPKAISNRMKAKGLQKLRWFCQVCQKQCRDENGFKCHTQSESHQRQMMVVADNPDKFIGGYSEMFEAAFLDNLRRRHGTKRMKATVVYNEYIADKSHVHMNATQWTTLTSFVQYLGRMGKCVVDETEKGWFIQYIDRDPKTIARQKELEEKRKSDLDHEERNRKFLQRQLKEARAKEVDGQEERPVKKPKVEPVDGKITLSLAPKSKKKSSAAETPADAASVFSRTANFTDERRDIGSSTKRSAVDTIMEEEERLKERKRKREEEKRQENWVTSGIVVKVMNKTVGGGAYYKKKGAIVKVKNKFAATVKLNDSGDMLEVDQDDLETVIPQQGRLVKIVNGVGRGSTATLLSINVDDFNARVRIESGHRRGETLDKVEYEDISKVAEEQT